jgi:hypothetical protein
MMSLLFGLLSFLLLAAFRKTGKSRWY